MGPSLFRRALSLFLFILACAFDSRAATVVWTNTVGGDWAVAANWDPNLVPGGSDEAIISAAGDYAVNIATSRTVGALAVTGSGVNLNLLSNTTLTVAGILRLEQGAISVDGALNCAGLEFTGGVIRGSGQFILCGSELKLPLASTRSVMLAWDPSASPRVAGYRIYYGSADGPYQNTVSTGDTTSARISGLLPEVTYRFAATAFDDMGMESDPSEPVFYSPPAGPTLDPVSDRIIAVNSGPMVFYLSGISSGGATSFRPLKLTSFSSNPALVNHPVVLHSNGESIAALFFAPSPHSQGLTVISVMLNDGQVTFSRSFILVVAAPNNLPTLDPLQTITVLENSGPHVVELTGISSGEPDESQQPIVTATSSDPNLVPDPVVDYASPDTVATLTFRPLPGRFGAAVISVSVDDGQDWQNIFTRRFVVVVEPADPPPVVVPPWLPFRPFLPHLNLRLTGL